MSMRCPGCHTPLDGSPRFCPECGVEVDPAATADVPPPAPTPTPPPSSSGDRFLAGQQLGTRYRIVQRLGAGGMGEVYRADDLELGQSVALKLLPARLTADERALDRLRTEVRLARTVSHANVCRVYDIGEADGHAFISMEYVDGEDLSHALRRMGRPSREKAEELARQLCLGLAAAHDAGVLHRDLKPANIMIDGRGRARITDFGLAGFAEDFEGTTELVGTPAYMAPEQLAEGRVSVQSDIYSLGLVLHELFTGRRVFETDSIEELRAHHSSGSSTTSSFGDIDPAVERALQRCLESDPGARPRSVWEVLAALPGGDPLAAALAAGETPSPELVASARSNREIRPRSVALLSLWVVGSIIAMAFVNERALQLPQRPPAELTVLAGEIATRELGLSELPPHDASGLILAPSDAIDGARPYALWRRWSPLPIKSDLFHTPEAVGLFDIAHTLPGSIAIVVDDTGTLVNATVFVAPAPHDPTAEADLEPILTRARLDPESLTAERVDPSSLDPPLPVHCDHVTIWRREAGGEAIARAGVHAGRLVAFERLGHAPGPTPDAKSVREDLSGLLPALTFFALIVMIAVAVYNLRRGRSDLRGALLTAVAAFSVYLLREILNFDLDDSIFWQVMGLIGEQAGGHALVHAVHIGLIYLAIEPIARRVWPRVLIGWVRLIDGRLRDSRVGVEILHGFAPACLVPLGFALAPLLGATGERVLRDEELQALCGSAGSILTAVNSAGLALFASMFALAFIATAYLIVRRPLPSLISAAVFLSLMFSAWGIQAGYDSTLAAIHGVTHGVLIPILFVRSGLVAVVAFLWLTDFLRLMVFTSELGGWDAPSTMFTVIVVLLVLAHGAWAAFVGREAGREFGRRTPAGRPV